MRRGHRRLLIALVLLAAVPGASYLADADADDGAARAPVAVPPGLFAAPLAPVALAPSLTTGPPPGTIPSPTLGAGHLARGSQPSALPVMC